MKQTAVDWLIKQLESEYNSFPLLNAEACIKAQEMAKQQIIKAAASAYEDMFGTDGTEYGQRYYDKLTQDDK
jgi:hypothetical protein